MYFLSVAHMCSLAVASMWLLAGAQQHNVYFLLGHYTYFLAVVSVCSWAVAFMYLVVGWGINCIC